MGKLKQTICTRALSALGGVMLVHASYAQYMVTSTNDDASVGSLRTILANAPANATITFATNLSGQTITLTNYEFFLSNNVTIDASALMGGIQINGDHFFRIFYIQTNTTVVLNSLTLTNSYVSGTSAFPVNGSNGYGGAIYNAGTLTLNQAVLAGNLATGGSGVNGSSTGQQASGGTGGDGYGGAIYNAGTLTLNEMEFR